MDMVVGVVMAVVGIITVAEGGKFEKHEKYKKNNALCRGCFLHEHRSSGF
jgi:hypothetical protein